MREKFERYIFKHAVQPLKLLAVVAIVAELSRRGLMFIGVPAFTSFITNMLGIDHHVNAKADNDKRCLRDERSLKFL